MKHDDFEPGSVSTLGSDNSYLLYGTKDALGVLQRRSTWLQRSNWRYKSCGQSRREKSGGRRQRPASKVTMKMKKVSAMAEEERKEENECVAVDLEQVVMDIRSIHFTSKQSFDT